jgi:hypothetical protein
MARATGSSRVFVAARSGNDANACNNVATPCQTFAGAIAQVSAGGEIIVVETGGSDADGILAESNAFAGVDMTLDRVQVAFNNIGLSASPTQPGGGTATVRLRNALITQNVTGFSVGSGGAVIGTSPGTNVVSGNGTDISGSLGTAITLQ